MVKKQSPNPDNNFSPNRKAKSSHKVKRQPPTSDNYIAKELAAPNQEYDNFKVQTAKRILDENLHYLSKDCYMRLNSEIVNNRKPETIKVMLGYQQHKSIDLLIRNCMLLFNEAQYD